MGILFVVPKLDSASPLTTNSSSMLYVVKQKSSDAMLEALKQGIEYHPLKHWLGEMKTINNANDLMKFCIRYSHVLDTLFPYVVTGNFRSEYEVLYVNNDRYNRLENESIDQWRQRIELEDQINARAYVAKLSADLPIYFFEAGEDNEVNYDLMQDLLRFPLRGARLS